MNPLSSFNMDRHQRVVVDTAAQPWLASPSPGGSGVFRWNEKRLKAAR